MADVLEVCSALPEQSTVTQAELRAAVEATCAVISLVRYGSMTFDLEGQLVFPRKNDWSMVEWSSACCGAKKHCED